MAVPANTPKEIVSRLNNVIGRALASSDVKERLMMEGLEAKGSSPEEITALVKTEFDRWGKVVKASGVKAD